jgi:ABC-type phosphate transport system substrate-binding protein
MRCLTTVLVVLSLTAWPQADAGRAVVPEAEELLGEQSATAEPLVIVVNRANPVDNLSFTELRTIFLGGRSHWANGRRITVVMRGPGDPERKAILRDVCGMNEDQLKTHFLRGLFTGEILLSPKILSTPAGVKKFVFNVPGAIGYLRVSDVDATVKTVRIDNHLPSDKGYRLHAQFQVANESE